MSVRRCVSCLVLLAALVIGPPPSVAQPASTPLTIESAVPDPATSTLTIAGTNFGRRPFVTLDLVPLTIQLALDARVLASVPVELIPPGVYLLTVSRGDRPGETASFDVRIGPAPAPAPPPASAIVDDVPPATTDAAAKVGDHVITIADVDREWRRTDPAGYLVAARRIYDARRRIAADLVNRELLTREADTRGVTVDALLAEELPKRTVPMPDTAVTSLFLSLGDRARGASLEQMRPALREWLARKAEPELARMTYLEELTKVSTRADILLSGPRVTVARAPDDPSLGSADAPVELVVFGDFQSPDYARHALVLTRIRDTFGSRVRIVFKHMPFMGEASVLAAQAGVCANGAGKFWEFHDALLGRAGALDRARFLGLATELGVNLRAFESCLDGAPSANRVRAAVDEARRYAITASPSILVNGRLAPESPSFLPPFEFFKRLIEEELQRQAPTVASPR